MRLSQPNSNSVMLNEKKTPAAQAQPLLRELIDMQVLSSIE